MLGLFRHQQALFFHYSQVHINVSRTYRVFVLGIIDFISLLFLRSYFNHITVPSLSDRSLWPEGQLFFLSYRFLSGKMLTAVRRF